MISKGRLLFFVCLVIAMPNVSCGQVVAAFAKAEGLGISVANLDEQYKSAVHSDSAKAVFNGREDEFQKHYYDLLASLGSYLRNNGFTWGKPTRCFNRIYVNKEGRIDYFLFDFKTGEVDPVKEQEFEKHVSTFIKQYKFPLTTQAGFAQCSPVKYSD